MAQDRTTARDLRDRLRHDESEEHLESVPQDALDALHKSVGRYRQILDNVSDAVYKIDTRGYFTYLNSISLQRTGLSPDRYQSCHFLELVLPEDRELARANFERVMRGEENPPYELRLLGPDSVPRIREVKSRPIFENGRVVELLGISRDITARKQAEELIVNAKAILERM
ncbi:MAG: PAS domain S-box protein, partial [Syntrophaceae bacterium]